MAIDSHEKVLLIGSTGLLGSSLAPFLASRGHETRNHGYRDAGQYRADLTDESGASQFLASIEPDVIVNMAGLTDVDRCEAEPNQAYLLNVRVVENIAGWISRKKPRCHLVHISTDQVYDGASPHTEDRVTLKNCYAFSKYAGELVASSVPSTILRTNFFGRSRCARRRSLTDWLFQSLSKESPIEVLDDVFFNPIAITTLSEIIDVIIRKRPIGIFNTGSHEGMSKGDLAFIFAEELRLPTRTMTRISADQATFLKTYRPKDMRMDCSKFERVLDIRLPMLRDEIKRAVEEYREIA